MIKLRKKLKGFTLVELLIVIAIIAVLAAVVTPVALNAVADSKATAVYAEIKSIETADLTHYVQKGTNAASVDVLDLSGLSGTKSKNAEYTALGGSHTTIPSLRTLTVKVSNGASILDIITKAGATAVANETNAYQFSDSFKVIFTTTTP